MKRVTIVSFIAATILLTGCLENSVKEHVFDEKDAAERKAVMDNAAKAAVAENIAKQNKAKAAE